MFLGFATLGNNFLVTILSRVGDVPTNGTNPPTVRVYGSSGLMTNGTGSSSFKDTASITGATNANPIVITSAAHGLSNGSRVTITGVVGNTAANTTATVANVATNTFELASVAGNGAYVSGGTWNVTGLYTYTVPATAANGYASGSTYHLLVTTTISSTVYSWVHSFCVV